MSRPVLVYQMGKVASSSLRRSLEAVEGLEVIHAHHLQAGYTEALNARKRALGWRTTIDPDQVRLLAERLSGLPDLPVISLVREPVGRNLSAYFNNLQVIFGDREAHSQLSHEQLLAGFLDRYPHEIPLEWFDRELAPSLGIDLFATPFITRGGALRVDSGHTRLLLLRHDLPDDDKAAQVAGLLGLDGLVMERDNIGEDKPYSGVYRDFISQVRLPPEYLERMLDSRYARHFFGETERARLKRYWSDAPRESSPGPD